MGGNRKGFPKQIRNILIVWLLTGFWHGASWNFVAWGLYFGVLLIVEKLFLLRFLKKLPAFFQHVYTMLLVMLGWAIFSFDSLGNGIATSAPCLAAMASDMGWGRRLSALYEYRAAADCGGGEHAAAEGALAPFGGQTFRSPDPVGRDGNLLSGSGNGAIHRLPGGRLL